MSKVIPILAERREEILALIAPLKAELRDIEKALAVISPSGPSSIKAPSEPKKLATSIVGQIYEILRGRPTGFTTREVVQALADTYDRSIAPKKASWYLSRQKRETAKRAGGPKVIQIGEHWRLIP